METGDIIAGLIGIAVLLFLTCALLFPERF